MTDYEEGAIGRDVIERRVKKFADELTDLRHSRDPLQFELDNTPDKITKAELATINVNTTKIITIGHIAQRKALCDLALDTTPRCQPRRPPTGSTSPIPSPPSAAQTKKAPRPGRTHPGRCVEYWVEISFVY